MATVSFVLYEVFLLNFLKGSVRPRIVNLTLSRVFFFFFFFLQIRSRTHFFGMSKGSRMW